MRSGLQPRLVWTDDREDGVPQNTVERAADIIAEARRRRARLGRLPATVAPGTVDEGYLVQEAVHRRLAAEGLETVAGWKIGCTTATMQDYLGIGQPCAGRVPPAGLFASGAILEPGSFVRVGIECEIAALMGAGLPPRDSPYDVTDVARAVGSYAVAIEVVDDRYEDWREMGAPALVADDFFAAGCVLGEWVGADRCPNLAKAVGRTLVNGQERGRGIGADVMGHPVRALTWLANLLAERGQGLRAGDFVLTGSLVRTVWLDPGDRVEVAVEGLGAVALFLARRS